MTVSISAPVGWSSNFNYCLYLALSSQSSELLPQPSYMPFSIFIHSILISQFVVPVSNLVQQSRVALSSFLLNWRAWEASLGQPGEIWAVSVPPLVRRTAFTLCLVVSA